MSNIEKWWRVFDYFSAATAGASLGAVITGRIIGGHISAVCLLVCVLLFACQIASIVVCLVLYFRSK